ncbi:MAG: hypothetical protein IJ083_01080 [Clostridia bacterium]|nr:hypothetical protein [Clostridia bacterium]
MKKTCILLLLCLVLISATALGEVDVSFLEATENCLVFPGDDGVSTVIRPLDQPYFGEVEGEGREILLYLDIVEMPDLEDLTLMRITFALETWEEIRAAEVGIRAGKKEYRFEVTSRISEYDMTYYEDYEIGLSKTGLTCLEECMKAKEGAVKVVLYGREEVRAEFNLPAKALQALYDRYKKSGALKQDLTAAEESWPCSVYAASN